MLLHEFNEDLTANTAGMVTTQGAPGTKKFYPDKCPRTSAVVCECDKINQLTESSDQVIAQCILELSDTVKGHVVFMQAPGTPTLIKGVITGLEPGEHGFHIHEFGDLTSCKTTGGHYNPDNVPHGDINNGHVGDLGNITANEGGVAMFTIRADRIDLMGERSVIGRSIVVHADPDDLGPEDDSGNSGERLACGVIALHSADDEVEEKAPPGREDQVKALKGKVNNPYAVSWASYNKSKNK